MSAPPKMVLLRRTRGGTVDCWEATWHGSEVEIASGPLGHEEIQYYSLGSPARADEFIEEAVGQHRADGYDVVSIRLDGGEAASQTRSNAAPVVRERGPVKAARNPILEAAIIESPDDPGPFLVYADWLEGEGDPRGELISLQIRGESGATRALVQAQVRLLLDHHDHFHPPHEPETIKATWKRGFYDRVAIDIEHLAAVLEHPSAALLRGLTVSKPLGPSDVALITERGIPLLEQLDVQFTEPPPQPFWPRLPALREVHIYDANVLETADTSRWQRLRLCQPGTDAFAALAMPRWGELRSLAISSYDEPDESFDNLCANLEDLSFEAEVQWGLLASPMVKAIKSLTIRCELDDGSVAMLVEAFGQLPALEVVDLRDNFFSEDAITTLSAHRPRIVYEPDSTNTDDEYGDEYDGEYDALLDYSGAYSADLVPSRELDEPETEAQADDRLAIDSTWKRGVVGFDHDE